MKILFFMWPLVVMVSIAACAGDENAATVDSWTRTNLSKNWSLKLPQSGSVYTEYTYMTFNVMPFHDDSMILKFTPRNWSVADAVHNYQYMADAVKKKNYVGYCLGSYDGEVDFRPFLDTALKLAGLVGDFNDHGQRSVNFIVHDPYTGSGIDMSFERLSAKTMKLVQSIIKSIQFHP
jgi:hypothetical protein